MACSRERNVAEVIAVGVDVGNSTTEVVLARLDGAQVVVLAAVSAPTRGLKGSPTSLDAAAALVRRTERSAGVRADLAVVAPLRPVDTSTVTVAEPAIATGRLRAVSTGAGTVGPPGFGTGRPVLLDDAGLHGAHGEDPLVAVVAAGVGYRTALSALRALLAAGRLAAVLLADDEAVLLANRLLANRLQADSVATLPVVDEVDVADAMAAALLSVEVSSGGVLRRLADPLALMADLGLDKELSHDELAAAARLAASLRDARSAVVALAPRGDGGVLAGGGVAGDRATDTQDDGSPAAWATLRHAPDERLPLVEAARLLAGLAVGGVSAYGLGPGLEVHDVDDLFAADLAVVADVVLARAGAQHARALAVAMLRCDHPVTDPAPALAERLGIEVRTVPSEAGAARSGALTTPGCSRDAVIVDVGGGTIDVVTDRQDIVAAGAGELLTAGVSTLTGATRAAAEWVKRGPAVRVETPHLLLGEDGSRTFLDRPAGSEAIGSLAVRGPAGLLAFDRRHAPGEWRALRLRLKADVLGGNVARALRTLECTPGTVVVVGGPAGDDEALAAVARALPDGVAVGRGDVAGSLGHRYAVAYGLILWIAR